MYIRHGDKAKEMKLVPFDAYAKAAEELWSLTNFTIGESHINSSQLRRTIVLGTETVKILFDALDWAEKANWNILINPLQIKTWIEGRKFTPEQLQLLSMKYPALVHDTSRKNNVVDSHGASRVKKSLKNPRGRQHQKPRRLQTNGSKSMDMTFVNIHPAMQYRMSPVIPEEYASMLINLSDLMQCDLFVCTLMSNYCRLLDELRATIGRKPQALFADLSIESCSNPPCYEGRVNQSTEVTKFFEF